MHLIIISQFQNYQQLQLIQVYRHIIYFVLRT